MNGEPLADTPHLVGFAASHAHTLWF
jgi:hypothetical protein